MVTTAEADTQTFRFPPTEWLIGIGLVLVVGVLVLGAKVQSVVGPIRTDRVAGLRLLTTVRAPRTAWQEIADVGSEIPVLLAVAALGAWAASKRDWGAVAVALIGPAGALFLTEYVLKPLVDRTSPKGVYSYPSGHSAVVAALVITALLFVYRYLGLRVALLWSPYAIAVISAMAIAVVALRWHYVTDAVGGVALGIGVVLLVAAAADEVTVGAGRRGVPAPVDRL